MEQIAQNKPLNLTEQPVRRGQSAPDIKRASQADVTALEVRVDALEAGGGGGSGTMLLDDGTATAPGGFSFDEGGA